MHVISTGLAPQMGAKKKKNLIWGQCDPIGVPFKFCNPEGKPELMV